MTRKAGKNPIGDLTIPLTSAGLGSLTGSKVVGSPLTMPPGIEAMEITYDGDGDTVIGFKRKRRKRWQYYKVELSDQIGCPRCKGRGTVDHPQAERIRRANVKRWREVAKIIGDTK